MVSRLKMVYTPISFLRNWEQLMPCSKRRHGYDQLEQLTTRCEWRHECIELYTCPKSQTSLTTTFICGWLIERTHNQLTFRLTCVNQIIDDEMQSIRYDVIKLMKIFKKHRIWSYYTSNEKRFFNFHYIILLSIFDSINLKENTKNSLWNAWHERIRDTHKWKP